jgi:serine/threonine protein kinase
MEAICSIAHEQTRLSLQKRSVHGSSSKCCLPCHLHSKGVIHRDLKLETFVFVRQTRSPNPK